MPLQGGGAHLYRLEPLYVLVHLCAARPALQLLQVQVQQQPTPQQPPRIAPVLRTLPRLVRPGWRRVVWCRSGCLRQQDQRLRRQQEPPALLVLLKLVFNTTVQAAARQQLSRLVLLLRLLVHVYAACWALLAQQVQDAPRPTYQWYSG